MLHLARKKAAKEVARKASAKKPSPKPRPSRKRTFKTAWFSKAARKAGITDAELCEAIQEAVKGQCSDLGGSVFKKRLKRNEYRSIILAKGGGHWFYVYLFAKSDRENIEPDELDEFRRLAKIYGQKTDREISKLLKEDELIEICHENQAEIQN